MINSNKEKQENWLNFQHKASRSKKGHYMPTKPAKESIFKTPDTFDSKVGVVRSGMGMTSESTKKKHVEYHKEIATPMDDKHYRQSKRRKYS